MKTIFLCSLGIWGIIEAMNCDGEILFITGMMIIFYAIIDKRLKRIEKAIGQLNTNQLITIGLMRQ